MIDTDALMLPASSRRLLGVVSTLVFAIALAACDTSKPATASETASASRDATKTDTAVACPSKDIKGFVAAFAEDPVLQKAFTAERVDTAFVDMSAQPEPAESVETLSRETLRFPVMPNRAQQQQEGLHYREVSIDADRALIALEIPDTDAQVLYTFRRDACWTLVKIVDPAFGKAFPGEAPVAEASRPAEPATPVGDAAAYGLSKTFAECMARAGTQTTARAECFTDERDRQDARLNKVYEQLIGHLQGERRERIVAAQRAWVQLQEKDGAFEASTLSALGAIGHRQQLENKTLATAQRADLLLTIADFAGDVPISDALRAPPEPMASNDENYVPRGLSQTLAKCMARAEGSLAQADCLTDERERQDARLNKVYKQLIGRLQGERRDGMVAAQRAWVRLQQSDADVRESILYELGQIGNLQSVENDARAIRQRADLLERYLGAGKL